MNIPKAAQASIYQIEKHIYRLPEEYLAMVNQSGKVILKRQGKINKVKISELQHIKLLIRALMQKRDVATHNHAREDIPLLSFADMDFAFVYNLLQMRAVSRTEKVASMELQRKLTRHERNKGSYICNDLMRFYHRNPPRYLGEVINKYKMGMAIIENEIPAVKFRTFI